MFTPEGRDNALANALARLATAEVVTLVRRAPHTGSWQRGESPTCRSVSGDARHLPGRYFAFWTAAELHDALAGAGFVDIAVEHVPRARGEADLLATAKGADLGRALLTSTAPSRMSIRIGPVLMTGGSKMRSVKGLLFAIGAPAARVLDLGIGQVSPVFARDRSSKGVPGAAAEALSSKAPSRAKPQLPQDAPGRRSCPLRRCPSE